MIESIKWALRLLSIAVCWTVAVLMVMWLLIAVPLPFIALIGGLFTFLALFIWAWMDD